MSLLGSMGRQKSPCGNVVQQPAGMYVGMCKVERSETTLPDRAIS